MANYIARVELHNATEEEDYEELHDEMEKRKFLRKIRSNKGVWYQLPTGTYVVQNTTQTLAGAYGAAVQAAKTTDFKYGLIVAEFKAAKFTGLERA